MSIIVPGLYDQTSCVYNYSSIWL